MFTPIEKREERMQRMLLKKVDDFFGTNFCEIQREDKTFVFKTETYHYRMIYSAGNQYLQRCFAPMLYYGKNKITHSSLSWNTIHDGRKAIVELDRDLLRQINGFFGTNFM